MCHSEADIGERRVLFELDLVHSYSQFRNRPIWFLHLSKSVQIIFLSWDKQHDMSGQILILNRSGEKNWLQLCVIVLVMISVARDFSLGLQSGDILGQTKTSYNRT